VIQLLVYSHIVLHVHYIKISGYISSRRPLIPFRIIFSFTLTPGKRLMIIFISKKFVLPCLLMIYIYFVSEYSMRYCSQLAKVLLSIPE